MKYFLILLFFLPIPALADGEPEAFDVSRPIWKKLASGIYFSEIIVSNPHSGLNSEVALLKVNPKSTNIRVSDAREFGEKTFSVKGHAKNSSALAAINANFYDPEDRPLGLVINNYKEKQKVHKGGSLLTGIFYIQDKTASIVKREFFRRKGVGFAIQSGPRLISNGKTLDVYRKDSLTRRSGVAVLETGEIVLFATLKRFPGARLSQIQAIFLSKDLKAKDVLNLDGGGSSGLYIAPGKVNEDEYYISGGDPVPIALLVGNK